MSFRVLHEIVTLLNEWKFRVQEKRFPMDRGCRNRPVNSLSKYSRVCIVENERNAKLLEIGIAHIHHFSLLQTSFFASTICILITLAP